MAVMNSKLNSLSFTMPCRINVLESGVSNQGGRLSPPNPGDDGDEIIVNGYGKVDPDDATFWDCLGNCIGMPAAEVIGGGAMGAGGTAVVVGNYIGRKGWVVGARWAGAATLGGIAGAALTAYGMYQIWTCWSDCEDKAYG